MITLTTTQVTALQSAIDADNIWFFYDLLDQYGDSYGDLGKGITNNDTWQGQLANGFAASQAKADGVDLSYGSTAWTNLNKTLAQAYLDAYTSNSPTNTTPTWDTIQTFHNDAYAVIGVNEDGWFPNKLLNDSTAPADDWDDWQLYPVSTSWTDSSLLLR